MFKLVGLWPLSWGILIVTVAVLADNNSGIAPTLKDSLTTPAVRKEGDDALLTCVVRNQNNFTLMWKKSEKYKKGHKILTANTERVTSDERVSVLHEPGGQVYVLLIKNVTYSDDGMFICEVNSDPPLRSFHRLQVLSSSLQPPSVHGHNTHNNSSSSNSNTFDDEFGSDPENISPQPDALDVWGYSTVRPITHDYTDCCVSKNVSVPCLGFCKLKNILDGTTGVSPGDCETDFPRIATCMADGRDHTPCCQQVGIPPACSDLCRGEFNVQTDSLKTHFSCSAHTAPTLACIAAGVDVLPGQPQDFSAAPLNETSISLSWLPPTTDPELTHSFKVNVTYLQLLSPVFSVSVDTSAAQKFYPPFSTIHTVPANATSLVLNNLEKFSLYEVSMWTMGNNEGRSLSTYSIRVVTHMEGMSREERKKEAVAVPELPDIKSCCISKNVSHTSCINKFCDPHQVKNVEVTDMMICAPWDTEIFSCLSAGRDHTPCCSAKQIPPICQELCTGQVKEINFQYFRCLSYMHEMSSCLMEGYGVLPSSPINFRFSNVDTTFGILHWEEPEDLADTVLDYVVHYQVISPEFGEKKSVPHAHSPFILEGLSSATTYEVYATAMNSHGEGSASSRIVFRTASRKVVDLVRSESPYNQTDCCLKSGLRPECVSLCSYNATMSDVERLAKVCAADFSKVVRCAAGGRDHLPCCSRRGVPKSCQPICQAVHQSSTGADFLQCLPSIGQVLTCWEEGTVQLPPPVRGLRAVEVSDGRVVLDWRTDDNNGTFGTTHFEVYYKKVDANSTDGTVFSSDTQINSTIPRVTLDSLETGEIYRVYVVSRNDAGTSLPSSLVRVNASSLAWGGEAVLGSSSPPHFLQLEAHSATWLQIIWNPPAITHPEDVINYRLHYHQVSANNTDFTTIDTDATSVKITGLFPNTQYILYATAVTLNTSDQAKQVESEPSESLIAWTDPAFPAFVEAPTIHPINMVTEGNSMTVLCIAMGTPQPTVTLYIDGHPLRSEVTRHMKTVVHNVTRDMGLVSCYADNGYGTPMQASRRITISRAPTVTGPLETHVAQEDTLTIICRIDAFPAPTMAIYRDRDLKNTVQSGGRVSITAVSDAEDPSHFSLKMSIQNVKEEDGGPYYCHANNTLGGGVALIGVNVSAAPLKIIDVVDCCRRQNVSSDCLDVCTFSIDFDTMLRKPHCVPEFHKLMLCASDGSDHRHCCSKGNVPGACLNWCRGEPVEESEVCALSHSKTIVGCFHEGRTNLPGPPRNIRVQPLNSTSAMVLWDRPEKNPDHVELYRVFWRPKGAKGANKTDTANTRLQITRLDSGREYELVVKAGNANGTSVLTTPLHFYTEDEYVIATSARTTSGSEVAGVVIAVFVIIGLFLLVLYVLKKKNIVLLSAKKPDSPTVSFENPFYSSRETNPQNNQNISEDNSIEISSSGSWAGELAVQNSNSQPEEAAENSRSNPSFLSGLKVGRPGQGFRRFH